MKNGNVSTALLETFWIASGYVSDGEWERFRKWFDTFRVYGENRRANPQSHSAHFLEHSGGKIIHAISSDIDRSAKRALKIIRAGHLAILILRRWSLIFL